jgi:D-alanyl-D-alanine carboxypeptidase/D-alanyl-D-alanine-endopeptidase (penicillin-binding protein 4)
VSDGNRSGGPLAALVAVLALPALALFGLWRFADGRTASTDTSMPPTTLTAPTTDAPAAALTTPLLSFRRVPGLMARDLNGSAFGQQAQAFADTLDATSCLVVALDGVPVATHNPDQPVIPASNQKLPVGAAALAALGPDFTFTTDVRASSPPSGGVVAGDLYLVGGGDPLLTTDDFLGSNITTHEVINQTSLDALADAVVAAGVSQVQGGIVADGSHFDDEFFRPTWSDDIRAIEAGPVDALLVNDARFQDSGGEWQVANDPNAGAGEELARLLRERGVSIAGPVSTGTAPGSASSVASIASVPLPGVIAEMMTTSDNNTAEMLLKEMGVHSGAAGSTDAGAAAMVATLQQLGVDTTGMVVDDGSGLSTDDRLTCRQLITVLGQHTPTDAFAAGLPVAGQTGTLQDVFTDSPVAGRLMAKTGTLANAPFNADPPAVKSLSGYLPVEGGGLIEFAFVLNSPGTLTDQSVYRPIWDSFADVLAAYPSGPSAADLGPR